MDAPEAVAGINRRHRRRRGGPLWNMVIATVIIGVRALCRGIMLRFVVVTVITVVTLVSVVSVVAVILAIIVVPALIMAMATAPSLGFNRRRKSTHAHNACCRQTTGHLPHARLLNRCTDPGHHDLLV
jgi:hypothetical protein